ncbi:UNVERIFIED_CONTAM: hypothetical protein FKN15_064663 [Acipenser sinensis]
MVWDHALEKLEPLQVHCCVTSMRLEYNRPLLLRALRKGGPSSLKASGLMQCRYYN